MSMPWCSGLSDCCGKWKENKEIGICISIGIHGSRLVSRFFCVCYEWGKRKEVLQLDLWGNGIQEVIKLVVNCWFPLNRWSSSFFASFRRHSISMTCYIEFWFWMCSVRSALFHIHCFFHSKWLNSRIIILKWIILELYWLFVVDCEGYRLKSESNKNDLTNLTIQKPVFIRIIRSVSKLKHSK